jgi:predicted RecB family nuclease
MKQTPDALLRAPTDLSNFLGCRHLTALDLRAARGELTRPVRNDAFVDDLRERGLAHEREYLEVLRSQGLAIAGTEQGLSIDETLDAMRHGVDVIYQGALAHGAWSGRADFLLKVPTPSRLGDWSYEACDTKLARDTRAGTILQLCAYSCLLERLQGVRPAHMHVVTPGTGFKPEPRRVDDYAAYFRLIERNIDRFLAQPDETYPELVAQCDYCSWWVQCDRRRRADDHLCHVAGISSTQIKTLRALQVDRLEQLATLEDVPEPARGSREALLRVREQARVQLRGRVIDRPYHEIKQPFDAEHGLARLPEPTPDDIFLDFEGDHFAEQGVQEYLLGYVMRGSDGQPVYTALWARTLAEERAAFERFMDLATAVRKRNPAAHIYHFAPYETAALKRLMGRHATREVELDALLRGSAFVDLHAVVKRALIASVERYSIKDLEPFFGYARAQDLREASQGRRLVENAIAAGLFDAAFDRQRDIVERYNREDCESALKLRDWLERLRAGVIAQGHELPRPQPQGGEPSEDISELDRELRRLRDGLLEGVPIEPGDRTPEQRARFALAHMMEFHRREDKASWWEYFRLLELEEHELAGERRALAGLRFENVIEARRAPVHRYSFPPQELDARKDDDVRNAQGEKVGTVAAVNLTARTIDVKKMQKTADQHPSAVFFHKRVDAKVLRQSLMRLGEAVIAHGFEVESPWRAAIELLLRRSPRGDGPGGRLQREGEMTIEAACRIARSLDGQVLAIQGPPGTGKTYTGAHVICALVCAGLKVGVTAVSHKVIVNLLEAAAKLAREQELALTIVHCDDEPYEGDWGIERTKDYDSIRSGLASGRIEVLGGTGWCWARPDFEQSVDVLIVDEAGQMSLANVLATAQAARSLVLLGDPQQLEQPLQSSHPEGSEVSALYHVLGGEQTIPPDKGLFLAETWRLHPDIARFTSEVYYEGRVEARPGLERQAIVADAVTGDDPFAACVGSGLRFVPVAHTGNSARAAEEVATIRALVDHLWQRCRWRDREGAEKPIGAADILIVAPYNAQVSALVEALPELAERIGTVDRFQGQEAPVVIYSMTSSSPEDAPRGMEFLYNRFRFNVATSRAKALCILVGSPVLFSPECKTPKQMKMANGFCRYLELCPS